MPARVTVRTSEACIAQVRGAHCAAGRLSASGAPPPPPPPPPPDHTRRKHNAATPSPATTTARHARLTQFLHSSLRRGVPLVETAASQGEGKRRPAQSKTDTPAQCTHSTTSKGNKAIGFRPIHCEPCELPAGMLSVPACPSPGSRRKEQGSGTGSKVLRASAGGHPPPCHVEAQQAESPKPDRPSPAPQGHSQCSPGRLWQAARRPWAWRGGMGAGVMGQSEGEGEVGAVCALHSKEVGAGMHRKGLCCNDTWKRLLEQPPHASHAGAPLRVSTLVALPPELVLPVRSGLPPFQTLQAVTVTSPRQKQTTSRRAGLWGRSTRQVC